MRRLALEIAEKAHAGQVDKGGNPYINHPKQVASGFDDEVYQVTALLHDVIEDSDVILDDLINNGITPIVVDAIFALTKQPNEEYWSYLDRVKVNPIARQVKLADIEHNMDMARIEYPTDKDHERLRKYKKAYQYLSE